MRLPRWTLQELAARYALAPDLCDVFVEGTFDRDVIRQAIRGTAFANRIPLTIDTIDIGPGLLAESGLSDGSKQRVIFLSRFLEKATKATASCIVDKDLDHWFGDLEARPHLSWTKYSTMELYFLDYNFVHDVVVAAGGAKIADWSAYYASLTDALTLLYSRRLADRQLGWSLSWCSFRKCLDRKGDEIQLDINAYDSKLLQSNSRASEREIFCTTANEWISASRLDPANASRGHDFTELLAWSVKAFGGAKAFETSEAVERLLVLQAGRMSDLLSLISR